MAYLAQTNPRFSQVDEQVILCPGACFADFLLGEVEAVLGEVDLHNERDAVAWPMRELSVGHPTKARLRTPACESDAETRVNSRIQAALMSSQQRQRLLPHPHVRQHGAHAELDAQVVAFALAQLHRLFFHALVFRVRDMPCEQQCS